MAKIREDSLLLPLGFQASENEVDGVTKVLLNEHEKGFRNGILFVMNLPGKKIEDWEQDQEILTTIIEREEEENDE